MKKNRKQIPINLNLDDPREEQMYDWYSNRTSNLSGFIKDIMYEYMGKIKEQEMVERQFQLLQGGNVKIEVAQQTQSVKKKKRGLGSMPGVD